MPSKKVAEMLYLLPHGLRCIRTSWASFIHSRRMAKLVNVVSNKLKACMCIRLGKRKMHV